MPKHEPSKRVLEKQLQIAAWRAHELLKNETPKLPRDANTPCIRDRRKVFYTLFFLETNHKNSPASQIEFLEKIIHLSPTPRSEEEQKFRIRIALDWLLGKDLIQYVDGRHQITPDEPIKVQNDMPQTPPLPLSPIDLNQAEDKQDDFSFGGIDLNSTHSDPEKDGSGQDDFSFGGIDLNAPPSDSEAEEQDSKTTRWEKIAETNAMPTSQPQETLEGKRRREIGSHDGSGNSGVMVPNKKIHFSAEGSDSLSVHSFRQ